MREANVTIPCVEEEIIRKDSLEITSVMQPAVFKDTDANFNISTAFMAVQILNPRVYIVINGRIFDPNNVSKNMETKIFKKK